MAYGKASPIYLGPCTNALSNASCGAVAWDERPANGGRVSDLTPYISISQQAQTCDAAADGGSSQVCERLEITACRTHFHSAMLAGCLEYGSAHGTWHVTVQAVRASAVSCACSKSVCVCRLNV